MIYPSDLQYLCESWSDRASNHSYPSEYREALSECMYDLNSLIDKTVIDELTEQDAIDYLTSQQADAYLSSMELYEQAEA